MTGETLKLIAMIAQQLTRTIKVFIINVRGETERHFCKIINSKNNEIIWKGWTENQPQALEIPQEGCMIQLYRPIWKEIPDKPERIYCLTDQLKQGYSIVVWDDWINDLGITIQRCNEFSE